MSFTIYPALDLRAGQVVRLKTGDPNQQTTYGADPAETAARWLGTGASCLHVVNLDGAFGEDDATNQLALKSILRLGAQVQFGGGLRSLESVAQALELGVSRIILGTLAIEQPEIVRQAVQKFGAEKIAVGIDARDGLVSVRGWKKDSLISSTELALQMRELGVKTILFTDIRRDGLGSGLNIQATCELAELSGLNVIASGGAQTLADIRAAKEAGLVGAIVGRALYEGALDLKSALEFEE
ncbi:MAG: 1-(5-phosphoribosyl)-5-[(5-phosphoribosylamino)methylideneamino]imidazole-4-carboxamide isomerase [Anaerolineales bacterium]|nr:1-(5-phosphoribosyl)-5-[(5-phosphoribosylamino)methylideneamino]imidazole-4-carboxamide isomerase [Anaerolineales bacterium]